MAEKLVYMVVFAHPDDAEYGAGGTIKKLTKEGYRSSGEVQTFESGGREGKYYEWILPSGNESYIYLTALLVTDKTITLAEAAAPHPVFIQYRQALLDSLASIKPRR